MSGDGCTIPRLSVDGAVYDANGWLSTDAYLDLRSVFPSDTDPSAGIPASSSTRFRGALTEDTGSMDGLRSWEDSRGRGWQTKHPCQDKKRYFSVGKWHSWRLAFLLARLQRAIWCHLQSKADLQQTRLNRVGERPYAYAPAHIVAPDRVVDRCVRRRIRGKACCSLSLAASTVLGQLDPLFHRWLWGSGEDGDTGLNPSPFDFGAMACTSRLLGHLAIVTSEGFRRMRRLSKKTRTNVLQLSESKRRLRSKQCRPSLKLRPAPTSLLRKVAVMFSESNRCKGGIVEAVRAGDTDAVRFHLKCRTTARNEALLLAVRHSQAHLVRFLISRTVDAGGCSREVDRAMLLHVALAIFLQVSDTTAYSIMEIFARDGADLNAPILPILEPGFEGPQQHAEALDRDGRVHREVVGLLPFLRRGDCPLAWAIRAHTACESRDVRQRLQAVVRCLIHHGASQNSLSQRQQRSLQELLVNCAIAAGRGSSQAGV